METHFMPYDKSDFRFIMANLFHDVIHDYGPGASDERWEKVQHQLTQFDKSRYTILVGGARGKHNPGSKTGKKHFFDLKTRKSKTRESKTRESKTRKSKTRVINSKTRVVKSKIRHIYVKFQKMYDLDITSNLVSEFAESVNAKICFNTFVAYCYYVKNKSSVTFADLFNPKESDEFKTIPIQNKNIHTFNEHKTSNYLINLYNQISYYVRYSGYTKTNTILNLESMLKHFIELGTNNIFTKLNDYILVSIYDTAQTFDDDTLPDSLDYSTDASKMMIAGGKAKAINDDLSAEDVEQLITELIVERNRFISNEIEIKEIYKLFLSKSSDYDLRRRFELNKIKDILQRYRQLNKSGTIDNASSCINKCCFLPPIPRSDRQSNKTLDEFANECFLNFYNISLIEYYTNILNGFKAEEEAIRLRLERDTIRAQSGQLTIDQRNIRDQFCSLIAKTGLVFNGEYSANGTQNSIESADGYDDTMTAKEINLLANWAKWEWVWPNPETQSTGIRSNIDAELFNTTYDHFSDNRMDIQEYPICRVGLRYVIDNAAMVPNALKDYVFCPVSSVVDGMKKCNSSQLEESGNMNFRFCEKTQYDTHYYNGSSVYNNDTKTVEYIIELKFPILETPFILKKQIPLAGTGLEAHNVLRETLVFILNIITELNNFPVIADNIYKNPDGIFGGLYEFMVINLSQIESLNKTQIERLNTLRFDFITALLNILFKGSGDLFQEINAVCKWGGYTGEEYRHTENVIPFNSKSDASDGSGNTLRMFIANDQPSGCRFAFLLLKGNAEFINEYAFGGYLGLGKSLLVTRVDKTSPFKNRICKPNSIRGGRTKRSYRK